MTRLSLNFFVSPSKKPTLAQRKKLALKGVFFCNTQSHWALSFYDSAAIIDMVIANAGISFLECHGYPESAAHWQTTINYWLRETGSNPAARERFLLFITRYQNLQVKPIVDEANFDEPGTSGVIESRYWNYKRTKDQLAMFQKMAPMVLRDVSTPFPVAPTVASRLNWIKGPAIQCGMWDLTDAEWPGVAEEYKAEIATLEQIGFYINKNTMADLLAAGSFGQVGARVRKLLPDTLESKAFIVLCDTTLNKYIFTPSWALTAQGNALVEGCA